MTPEQRRAFEQADVQIVEAINAAKDAGVAQGLIVAMLHGHAHMQTSAMVKDS